MARKLEDDEALEVFARVALRAALASAVLGVSKSHLSTTITLPSAARSERAEANASLTIFLGVFWL